LKDGLLGDASNVRASRTKTGPFENLRSYPEFRDLVVAPAPLAVPRASGAAAAVLPDGRGAPATPSSPRYPGASPAATVPGAAAVTAGEEDAMPHIDLDTAPRAEEEQPVEWLKWILLLFIAV